jgi:hypothetical protein
MIKSTHTSADLEALAELDAAVAEMDALLGYYEHVLADHGIRIPYGQRSSSPPAPRQMRALWPTRR